MQRFFKVILVVAYPEGRNYTLYWGLISLSSSLSTLPFPSLSSSFLHHTFEAGSDLSCQKGLWNRSTILGLLFLLAFNIKR